MKNLQRVTEQMASVVGHSQRRLGVKGTHTKQHHMHSLETLWCVQRKRCNSTKHFSLVTEFEGYFYGGKDTETITNTIMLTLDNLPPLYVTDMYLPIGNRLKKLRNEAKLSRNELAELAGTSCKTIMNIEHNRSQPNRKTAQKLIKALNVHPASLTVNAEDFFSMDIRTQLKVLRLSLCLSQQEFASLCNFDASTIRDWELGKREMNIVNKMFASRMTHS